MEPAAPAPADDRVFPFARLVADDIVLPEDEATSCPRLLPPPTCPCPCCCCDCCCCDCCKSFFEVKGIFTGTTIGCVGVGVGTGGLWGTVVIRDDGNCCGVGVGVGTGGRGNICAGP